MHRLLALFLGHLVVTGALVAPLGARVGPSVPLTLQSPRLARPRMADPQETGRDELDEGKMKNINKAGPSEDREKELRKLMEKLKKRGAVSDSRRVVDESVGEGEPAARLYPLEARSGLVSAVCGRARHLLPVYDIFALRCAPEQE